MLPYLTSLGRPLPLEREQLFVSARRPIGQGVRVEGREAGGPGQQALACAGQPVPHPLPFPTTHIMLREHCSLPEDQALPSQSPKTGLCCKMVLQAVSKVLRKSKAKPNGKKPAAEERKAYLEPEHTKARITDFQFKELVVLPREIDLNEWLASNTTTFFHHINLQYSTISEFCTGETCQTMAVCNTQYYWYDERGKKVKCTAPQYVDFVMSSVQKLVTDEDVFPTKYGREFPTSFESLVRKICRHLFHVLAHIYWAHFKETLALELHGHLNTLYVHFILFAREFNLLDPKETAVMDDLTEVLCSGAGGVHSGGSGDGAGSGGPGAQNHVKER
nr:MOB kinase activator 2 isoform X3 [Saimiri boliviensis boliviensis]